MKFITDNSSKLKDTLAGVVKMKTSEMADMHNAIDYTVELTNDLENGVISTNDYLEERARLVGKANIVQNLILPLLSSQKSWYKRLKEITSE